MRHRLQGRKLGRTTAHRKAMFSNLITSFFTYGRIYTTVAKAKEARSIAEKLITRAKKGGLHNFRYILSILHNKDITKKLLSDIAGRFADRGGGYTRIIRLGGSRWDGEGRGEFAANRLNDNAKRAILELVVKKTADEEKVGAGLLDKGEAELKKLKEEKTGKKKAVAKK